ncbi:hypothetical protein AAEJ42_23540, partial [Shewanella algae]|uniref:hypothetical protein n=1 Tax=Shewanella algae TaxID=38313 RepID=UPI00313EFEAC
TILIASNRRGETRRLTISAAWVKAFSFLGFVVLLIMGTAAVDYVGLLLTANENQKLVAENLALKKQFESVEIKLTSLE